MRSPAVAGSFYPFSASVLRADVERYLSEARENKVPVKKRLALVCPHAGYVYSGKTAAYSFASCDWKGVETAVVIGPNHTGMGMPISVSFDDWKTPMGELKCDVKLAEEIVKAGKIARHDELAHLQEHSCEVQLPFLQKVCPAAKVVCICMGWQDGKAADELGRAVFAAVKKLKRRVVVVASSDFTHYEPADVARKKDMIAAERLLALDEKGFEGEVEARGFTICGHGPIAAAMNYAKLAGAKKCELLKYTNSGEATGDDSEVVAYASFAIS